MKSICCLSSDVRCAEAEAMTQRFHSTFIIAAKVCSITIVSMSQPAPAVDAILARAARLRALGAGLLRDVEALNPAAADPAAPPSAVASDPISRLRPPPQLLKAQTTRLGLMLLNPPLAPSALDGILADLERRALPAAFAATVDITSRRAVLGACFSAAVLAALRGMLTCVGPVVDAVHAALSHGPTTCSSGNVPLDVGRAWAACDALVALADGGVIAAVCGRLRTVLELVRDARSELDEWRADLDYEAETGGDEDGGSARGEDDDDESVEERERALEELAGNWTLDSDNRLPAYRTDLVDMCELFLRRSGLARKILLAVVKSRIKSFSFPSLPFKDAGDEALAKRESARFDRLVELAESVQTNCDEFACGMYDLNGDVAELHLKALTKNAVDMTDLASLTWDQKEDELTSRLQSWKMQLGSETSPQASQ
jgi:hypothetical protein